MEPTRFEGPLEVYDPPKKEYMKKFKRYEPVVMDHSSVITAMYCKKKYFLRIVLGFVPKTTPQYFGFGSCYHKFREVLEKKWLGMEPYTKTEDTMECFATAMSAARDLWKRKRMHDPQLGDKWDFLTEARLVQSCTTAFKHWLDEKNKGRIKVIAVEQNFVLPLPDGKLVAGKADQIVLWNGKVWGRDFKTSSKEQNAYFARTLDPNDQFTRYSWAESELSGCHFTAEGGMEGGMPVQGILIEVLYNGKSTKKEQKGPSIHPHMASRSPTQLARWVKEQMTYSKILKLMRDEDVYPMEPHGCSFCEFHSVCSKSGEQAQMAKLESEFKVEPWDCVNRTDDD